MRTLSSEKKARKFNPDGLFTKRLPIMHIMGNGNPQEQYCTVILGEYDRCSSKVRYVFWRFGQRLIYYLQIDNRSSLGRWLNHWVVSSNIRAHVESGFEGTGDGRCDGRILPFLQSIFSKRYSVRPLCR